MHELLPAAKIFALLVNPKRPFLAEAMSRDVQSAARTLGLQLHVLQATSERELEAVFANLRQVRADALVIGVDAFFNSQSEYLAALAVRYAVPSIYQYREFATAGGLMSYGGSLRHVHLVASMLAEFSMAESGRSAGAAIHQSRVDLNLKTAKAFRHPHFHQSHCLAAQTR